MKRAAVALTALALMVGFAVAQPAASDAPKMMKVEKIEKKMMAMPEMTAEQQEKMDAMRIKHMKEMMPMQTDLRIKELELAALWRADKLEAGKIVAKVKEINDVRGKLELARVNHRIEMHSQLTPEQRKAMGPGMMGGCGGRRGMMRGRGMGRGAGCGMMGGMDEGMGQGMRGMGKGQGGAGGCQGGGDCGDCGMQ
jgi:Spy/CpxP family protein refolding chaperone